MSESVRATIAEPQPKAEKARSENRTPDGHQHPTGLQAQILHQQKTIGNRAVQRLIMSGSLHAPVKPPSTHRKTQEPSLDASAQTSNSQVSATSPLAARGSGRPGFQIPRAITQVGPSSVGAPPKQAMRVTQGAATNRIHRHWYNVSVGGYEFDPSIEGIKTAAGLVKDAAVDASDWIVDKIKGLVSDGVDWLTEKWHDLENLVGSAMHSVESALGAIVRFFLSPLNALADAIMSFDSQAVDKAWKVLSGIVTTVSNGFKATIDAVLEPVKKLWGVIDSFASSTLDSIAWLFDKLPGVLQKVAQPFVDKIKNLWKSINDWWTENFNKLKAWAESAVDKVFGFVRRIMAFGINVVVQGIVQFGQIVLFIKDFIANPQKYIAILVQKSVKAFDGVESKFAGLIHQHFGSSAKAQAAPATETKVQRQPAAAAPAEAKTSATWSEIGDGVWGMMKKKWNEFKSNPLSIVTGLLMDLVLPIVGDVKDIIKLFQDIKKIVTGPLSAGSLEELWTSILQILDIPILIYQTVVSILMRTLMVPLIVATFVPHPLVKAIAAAVGEALLAAFVEAEVLNIGHKLLLLKTGATVKSQKDDAYNRVADSLIAGAMTVVIVLIMLILHFIANIMKGIFNFVKGKVFRVETPAVGGEGRGGGEGKGKGSAEDVKPADIKGEELPSQDGKRKLKIDEKGKCEVCASPCDDIREKYDLVMTPEDEAKIKAIEDDLSLSDTQKEEKLKPIEQDLADADKKAQALRGKEPVKPKLDGKDYKRILAGELLDLTEFMNEGGDQLRIDPDYRPPQDAKGRTNAERAKDGVASILPNGEGVELHHTTQDFFSPLDEHSRTFHQSVLNDPDFHPSTGDPGYLSWRGEVAWYKGKIRLLGDIYDLIRGKYWRRRFK
jgi:hypothetical protein